MIQAFPVRDHRPAHSDEPASAVVPWLLRFARTPDPAQARTCPSAIYDAHAQMSLTPLGEPVIWMATHTPTNPDGDPANPPPFDEGAKD